MDAQPLAELRTLIAAQGARLAAQEAQGIALRAQFAALRARCQPHRRPRHIRRQLASVAVALLIALIPLGLLAANPFNDLTGGVHDADIAAIHAAGITTGCAPDTYCPTANVTRQEMASFLARTAGLGDHAPVANARTVGGYAPDGLVRAFGDGNAGNGGVVVGANTDVIAIQFIAPAPGFVLVTGSVLLVPAASGCPCRIGYQLVNHNGDPEGDGNSPLSVQDLENNARQSGTISWVFRVPVGPQTFLVEAALLEGTAAINAFATLTGLYVPFGETP